MLSEKDVWAYGGQTYEKATQNCIMICITLDTIQVDVSRRMKWVNHVARMGRNVHRVLVRKPKGKRPLDKSRNRWKNDIKMYLKEVRWEGVDWINLAQDRHNWPAFVK
jgi:hypothetical protein